MPKTRARPILRAEPSRRLTGGRGQWRSRTRGPAAAGAGACCPSASPKIACALTPLMPKELVPAPGHSLACLPSGEGRSACRTAPTRGVHTCLSQVQHASAGDAAKAARTCCRVLALRRAVGSGAQGHHGSQAQLAPPVSQRRRDVGVHVAQVQDWGGRLHSVDAACWILPREAPWNVHGWLAGMRPCPWTSGSKTRHDRTRRLPSQPSLFKYQSRARGQCTAHRAQREPAWWRSACTASSAPVRPAQPSVWP